MNDVTALLRIPPAQVLDGDAEVFQRTFAFFDLNLEAAMRQEERLRMVKKHFHGRSSASSVLSFKRKWRIEQYRNS
jgi:hypothetical protein